MHAFVTKGGTAMPEAALCDEHARDMRHVSEAKSHIVMAVEWNGTGIVDRGSGDGLRCIICGKSGRA